MLGVDFKTFDIGGTLVMQAPVQCEKCGKRSGFDDFVHEALTTGIHTKEFILRMLNKWGNGDRRASPPHQLRCMNCNIYFRQESKLANNTDPNTIEGEVVVFGWASGFGWEYGIEERDQDTIRLMDEKANALKVDEAGKP